MYHVFILQMIFDGSDGLVDCVRNMENFDGSGRFRILQIMWINNLNAINESFLVGRVGSNTRQIGSRPGRAEPGLVVSNRVGPGRAGSGRGGPGRVGPGRVGSGRVGPGRVGPGRIGLGLV